MERLTERKNGTAMIEGCGSNCKYGFEYCRKEDWENCKTIEDVIDKLADYEDLEEQGRLIKLPCKVGDSIYSVIEDGLTIIELKFSLDFYVRRKNDIGKTVFLTKSEAEAKLKELRGEKDGN